MPLLEVSSEYATSLSIDPLIDESQSFAGDRRLATALTQLATALSTAGRKHAPASGVSQHTATLVGEDQIMTSLPIINAANCSASAAGKGRERRSHDFGVLHCSPPDSVTD